MLAFARDCDPSGRSTITPNTSSPIGFPAEQASLALRDYLREKYRGRRIDVVVAVTDTSLRFALRFREELFPNVPIVYFGNVAVDEPVRRDGAGVTGVTVGSGFRESVGVALSLHPSTEHVFVVAQIPNMALQDSVRSALKDAAERAQLTFITEASVPRLLAAVRAVPANSLILYLRHSQEEPGRILFSSEVARLVADASPVPVYGVSDSYLGSGVVGGVVYQTRAIGVRLGQQVLQIFDGTRAQDLPIESAAPVPIFDWRQLQRWGINESQLPPGSNILYRQVGVWDLYKPQIIGAIFLVAVQTALIGTLLLQRSRRRRIQNALLDSQQRYTLASAAGAVGVWDWNFETNELFVDPGLKAILGFDDREISTRPDDWGSRVHPQDLAGGGRRCQELHRWHYRHVRDRASDGAQGWQREVDAVARVRAATGRRQPAPVGGHQGRHHRTEAGRGGDSREPGGAGGQPSAKSTIWPDG